MEESDIYGQILTTTQIPYCTLFLSYKNIAFPA